MIFFSLLLIGIVEEISAKTHQGRVAEVLREQRSSRVIHLEIATLCPGISSLFYCWFLSNCFAKCDVMKVLKY
jgi:hypothetical protein